MLDVTIGFDKNLEEAFEVLANRNSPLVFTKRMRGEVFNGRLVLGFGDRELMIPYHLEGKINPGGEVREELLARELGFSGRSELSASLTNLRDFDKIRESAFKVVSYLNNNGIATYTILRKQTYFGNDIAFVGRNPHNRLIVTGTAADYIIRT